MRHPRRDGLAAALAELGVGTGPELTDAEVTRVASAVGEACARIARRGRDVVSEVTR